MKLTYKIDNVFDSKSIHEFLTAFYVGRKTIYQGSVEKRYLINGVAKHDLAKLKTGDTLDIILAEKKFDLKHIASRLDIVYEDADMVIINKQEKLLVHTDGTENDNLTDVVNAYYQSKGYYHEVLPAHRIDYETSGLVVFAKHFIALSYLSHLFETHQVKKTYIGLVKGPFTVLEDVIDQPLLLDKKLKKMIVSKEGKPAKTIYHVLDNQQIAKVRIEIKTGRTHQIRAHFAYINHPLIGDPVYGIGDKRLMLHAFKIAFKHPRTFLETSYETEMPFSD